MSRKYHRSLKADFHGWETLLPNKDKIEISSDICLKLNEYQQFIFCLPTIADEGATKEEMILSLKSSEDYLSTCEEKYKETVNLHLMLAKNLDLCLNFALLHNIAVEVK